MSVEGGEASLYGTFGSTVEGGVVVTAEPLDERAVQSDAGLDVQTYQDILDHLAYAEDADYDNVRVQTDPGSGRPVYVAVDDSQSIDEERYYTITEYTEIPPPTPVPSPSRTPTGEDRATYGSEGDWRDQAGDAPPPRSIVRVAGPEHCGWAGATFLEVDWSALGLDVPAGGGGYVDDLGQILLDGPAPMASAQPPDTASAQSLTLEDVPAGAIDSGYSEDGVRLWAARDGAVIWLEFVDRVEQWPRLLVGCM